QTETFLSSTLGTPEQIRHSVWRVLYRRCLACGVAAGCGTREGRGGGTRRGKRRAASRGGQEIRDSVRPNPVLPEAAARPPGPYGRRSEAVLADPGSVRFQPQRPQALAESACSPEENSRPWSRPWSGPWWPCSCAWP